MSEPKCPKCDVPMRLMRVVPSILPPETSVETRVFACAECATIVTNYLGPRVKDLPNAEVADQDA
jgi:hypothetical protein